MVEGLGKNLDKIKSNLAEIETQLSLWTNAEVGEEPEEN